MDTFIHDSLTGNLHSGTVGAGFNGTLPSVGGQARRLAIDIDGTLSHTAMLWAEKLYARFPIEGATVAELLAKYRLASLVPQWQEPEPAAFVAKLRVCPDTHLEYQPIEGAVDGVRQIAERIGIEYLTMRPRCVLSETAQWLELYGFPSAEIVACPDIIDFHLRPAWKAQQLHDRHPSLIGIVEDDTKVVLSLPNEYRGTVFLFSHETAPRADIRVLPCATWANVEHQIARALDVERPIDLTI